MSLTDLYLWLKALHVAAATTFIGGLLVISIVSPLIKGPATGQRSLVASVHRWDRQVTVPALLLVWSFGLTLALEGGHFGERWLQLKLLIVVVLSAIHGVQSGKLRHLAAGAEVTSGRWAPIVIVLAAAIAVLAVSKPF